MDSYDQYAALKNAGAGTNDRINKLNAYAALFDKMGMGEANPVGQQVTGFGLGGSYNNPQMSRGQQSRNALDWATRQLDNESIQQQRAQQAPDFFSGQSQQFQQIPAYVSRENPFTANAMSTGDAVTNYLKRYTQPQQTRGGSTLGVKG